MAGDFEDRCWRDVVSAEALAIYRAYEREHVDEAIAHRNGLVGLRRAASR